MLHNRDDVNDDTMDITAAKKSQAAVLVADSVVEKDGAVTERRHFPKNLNMPGFVVFSVSCPIHNYIQYVCIHICTEDESLLQCKK